MILLSFVLWLYRLAIAALRTSAGRDLQSEVMGAGFAGDTGTSTTAPTATTFTCDGKSYTVNALIGHIVQRGTTYGVILSNTATVLTIDKWYNPASPGGVAAATPAAGDYVIFPGGAPHWWIALTEDATAPADGDTVLTGELTGAGLLRALATYAHTAGANTFTLTKAFTSGDATTRTLRKAAFFNTSRLGRMAFETAIPDPPVVANGDSATLTDTFSLV